MHSETRFWRFVAVAAVTALAFVVGRGTTPPAEARQLLLNASHVGTNEDGDILWVYDFDGANRQWVVIKVDGQKGTVQSSAIPHPRTIAGF